MPRAAKEKALQVVEKLKLMRLAKAAEIVAAGIDETLSYYAMPPEHWRCLRTNNPNPTTFQHANEERKCEKPWTLPVRLPGHNSLLLSDLDAGLAKLPLDRMRAYAVACASTAVRVERYSIGSILISRSRTTAPLLVNSKPNFP